MEQTSGDAGPETTPQTKKELTCPLCESTLIGEAIEAGKCQCCGHRFDPEELKKQRG
jgi:rubredoxin